LTPDVSGGDLIRFQGFVGFRIVEIILESQQRIRV